MYGENRKRCSGQVIAEYALMLVMFAGIALILLLLYALLSEYGWRAISLIAWEPVI